MVEIIKAVKMQTQVLDLSFSGVYLRLVNLAKDSAKGKYWENNCLEPSLVELTESW
jgi:hypothetical protein